ncbi:hypothetical protein N8J89_19090 [Crossiella sp. CA-258035]|uniref:hypothetical protein n=1 Tax=Crossiella sp. CA-258035 TaxID=2981138 RepID=UPI0024BC7704|nr:hypothetical protein [Crossiella sp. CA-258035]WHT23096.1 hypothetical protein N8J89_19090 [Crossiella sp. CA-258035]
MAERVPEGRWTAGRVVAWVVGGVITLAAGTVVVGLVLRWLLPGVFGPGVEPTWPHGVGFGLTAIYLAWLVARAVRRGG